MGLPFDEFLNFAELALEVCADIFDWEGIWNPADKNLGLGIPLFEVNLLFADFEFFFGTKILDLLSGYHQESLKLPFLLSELYMLQCQPKFGEAADDKRLRL